MVPQRRLCVTETPDPNRCWPDGSLKIFGPDGRDINEPCDPTYRLGEQSYPAVDPAFARHSLPASPRYLQGSVPMASTSSWMPQPAANTGPPPLPASEGPPPLPASTYSRRPARVLFRRREDLIFCLLLYQCVYYNIDSYALYFFRLIVIVIV